MYIEQCVEDKCHGNQPASFREHSYSELLRRQRTKIRITIEYEFSVFLFTSLGRFSNQFVVDVSPFRAHDAT